MHYVFVDGTKVSLSTCRRYLSRKYLFFVHLLFIRTRHHGNQCFKVNTSAVLAEIACQVVSNLVGHNRKLALVVEFLQMGHFDIYEGDASLAKLLKCRLRYGTSIVVLVRH